MPSLGHTDEVVKALKTIDIPGCFVTKSRELGIQTTLMEVNYSPKLNFNLLSLLRLMWNCWKITSGDETRIKIEDSSRNVVLFDIIILTAQGAIFACRFVHNTEITVVSMEIGMKVNILKAHSLLGHEDEESMRHAVKELGLIITHGTL